MTRRRFLIVVLVFLLILLVALVAGFVAFRQYAASPAAAEAPGFAHVRTLYGWGDDAGQLFERPFGAVYRNGSLYVVDKDRSQVIQMTPEGSLERLYGSGGKETENLRSPTGVEVDASGNVYVTDSGENRIVVYGPDGQFTRAVKLDTQPLAMALSGSRMFVTTAKSVKVLSMPKLDELASWGEQGRGDEEFHHPNGIAFDEETGTIYVSDGNNLRVKAMDENGKIRWIYGQPPADMNDSSENRRFGLAGGMAFAQGYLFVADPLDAVIHVINADGEEVAQVGDAGRADGQFDHPIMVTPLSDNQFAITEWGNGRVQIVDINVDQASGAWQDQAGDAAAVPSSTESTP